jgi:hypothetical protein
VTDDPRKGPKVNARKRAKRRADRQYTGPHRQAAQLAEKIIETIGCARKESRDNGALVWMVQSKDGKPPPEWKAYVTGREAAYEHVLERVTGAVDAMFGRATVTPHPGHPDDL